jgi:riboflavin kinase/FMN adenylyltransferase
MLKVLTQPDKEFSNGCIVTVGNFDGVHLGHQALFEKLKEESEARQLPMAILLFEPQAAEFLNTENPPARLMTWLEKIEAIKNCFTDNKFPAYVLTLHFDAQLAAISADEFVHQVLLHELNVKHIIVGKDFHFGRERAGNLETLCKSGQEHNHDFTVDIFEDFTNHEVRVSSTLIRSALANKNLNLAKNFLGRRYSMQGEVLKGEQRGRTLGFPTANIALERIRTPLAGVFAVKVTFVIPAKAGIQGNKQDSELGAPIYGVANIGSRPTVDGKNNYLEVHLFDFNQEIYGQILKVEFLEFIRDEKKFDSLEALKAQIQQDVDVAIKYCPPS